MRGKYRNLYAYLCGLRSQEWPASFTDVEMVLGFRLPLSAHMHRPWWANQSRGNRHSHALAWTTAGWETAQIDMETETLLFRRRASILERSASLDEFWPVLSAGAWPADLSLRREHIYEDRV